MYATQALTHLVPLAKEVDDNKVTPGVLGFLVFAALAVGVWLLMKSMNRHMGKVDFDEGPAPAGAGKKAAEAGAAGSKAAGDGAARNEAGVSGKA